MRLTAEPTTAPTAKRCSRHLVEYLTIFVSLLLVAAVAPARSRDRGGSRSAAARASHGSQRWELQDDVCEYPLRVTEVESHRLTTAVSATSSQDASRDAESGDRSMDALFILERTSITLDPCLNFDEALLGTERSRAPPLSA